MEKDRKKSGEALEEWADGGRKEQSVRDRVRMEFRNQKGRIQNSLSGFLRVCLVGLLVLAQIAIIVCLPFLFRRFTIYFYVILELVSIVIILALVNSKRSPSYRMAWMSIILILPVSGYIMYVLWGCSTGTRKKDRYILSRFEEGEAYSISDSRREEAFAEEHVIAGRMSKYLSGEHFPLYTGNRVDYYKMGEEAFEYIFEELEKAEKFIFIEFFIVAEGLLWDRFHEILKKKKAEGVEIKFLYDDFGAAIRTNKNFRRNLEEEGIEVRVFNPIRRYTDQLYVNFRTHQKILVVDGKVGFTGGFNIADEYANLVRRFGIWKDTGIRVEGEAAWGLTVAFLQMWSASEFSTEKIDYLKYKSRKYYDKGEVSCHVLTDGPANNPNNPIESVYNQLITYAGKYLYIMTPYLVLEDYMQQSLIEAVKRGVDVRIITPGIPDKKSVNRLTQYHYGRLLENGVRIYEYTPGFIHAKSIVTEEAAIVGTINMDYRSFYLHYENGVWLTGGDILEKIREDYLETFRVSREVTYEEWLARPLHLKILQVFLNLFATLL